IHAEFPHHFSTQFALRLASVDEQHSFLLYSAWDGRGEQRGRRHYGVHADTERGCTRDEISPGLGAFAVCSITSWVRFRLAMFCLRCRLNLDLSPFREDIMISCYSAVNAGSSQLS